MNEDIVRLREISEEIDELFNEAIDIVSGHPGSLDSALEKNQRDSIETLEDAIAEMENEADLSIDDEEEDEIDDDELD